MRLYALFTGPMFIVNHIKYFICKKTVFGGCGYNVSIGIGFEFYGGGNIYFGNNVEYYVPYDTPIPLTMTH